MKKLFPKEVDAHLDRLDLQPILASRVHRVKWLYNNSNKNTLVYEEKLVRLIIDRLQKKIQELEKSNPVKEVKRCPICNSKNVVMFTPDDDRCQDCGRYWPA